MECRRSEAGMAAGVSVQDRAEVVLLGWRGRNRNLLMTGGTQVAPAEP